MLVCHDACCRHLFLLLLLSYSEWLYRFYAFASCVCFLLSHCVCLCCFVYFFSFSLKAYFSSDYCTIFRYFYCYRRYICFFMPRPGTKPWSFADNSVLLTSSSRILI